MAQYDLKHVVVKIKDGTSPTPNELEIKFGDGTFAWTEKTNFNYPLDRGNLDEVVEGDQSPVEINFEGKLIYVASTGSEDVTITEALKRRGAADEWVSSDADDCRPYSVKLEATYTPACGSTTEKIVFPTFRAESCAYDLKSGKITISGKDNVLAPTITRT